MAAPEETVTVDAVCQFFVQNGGRATNKELVSHFRNPAFDQQQKERSRELLKSIVNKVATIKTVESGERFLVLKAEYEPKPSPATTDSSSSSLLDDFLSALQSPVGSQISESQDSVAEFPALGLDVDERLQPAAESQDGIQAGFSNDEPPVLPFSRTKPASSASPIPAPASSSSARAPLPSYEQLFVKSSPHASPSPSTSSGASSKPSNTVIVDDFQNPVPPPRKNSRAASVASSKENNPTSDQPPKPPRLPLKEVNTAPALASPEDMSLGSESIATGSAADISDMTPSTPGSLAGDVDMAEENSIVSVKERALKLNKIQSESELQKQISPPRKKTGDRTSAIGEDDGHSTNSGSIELTKEQRAWLIVAATSDYHPMAKMLNTNPLLAKMKDFISGYTALHWASKSGQLEVVKLVAGCGVDVNSKSNGGYTALHLAAMQGHNEIMTVLEEAYGANPHIRDHGGKKAKAYLKNSTVQYLFNGQSSGHIQAAAQGFAQRFHNSNGQVSDDEDSVFHRGMQMYSGSFSARVKRTRDTFLTHLLHGVSGGGGGGGGAAGAGGGAVAALIEGITTGAGVENGHVGEKAPVSFFLPSNEDEPVNNSVIRERRTSSTFATPASVNPSSRTSSASATSVSASSVFPSSAHAISSRPSSASALGKAEFVAMSRHYSDADQHRSKIFPSALPSPLPCQKSSPFSVQAALKSSLPNQAAHKSPLMGQTSSRSPLLGRHAPPSPLLGEVAPLSANLVAAIPTTDSSAVVPTHDTSQAGARSPSSEAQTVSQVSRSPSSVSPKKTKRKSQKSVKRRQPSETEASATEIQREKEARSHYQQHQHQQHQQHQQQQQLGEVNEPENGRRSFLTYSSVNNNIADEVKAKKSENEENGQVSRV